MGSLPCGRLQAEGRQTAPSGSFSYSARDKTNHSLSTNVDEGSLIVVWEGRSFPDKWLQLLNVPCQNAASYWCIPRRGPAVQEFLGLAKFL